VVTQPTSNPTVNPVTTPTGTTPPPRRRGASVSLTTRRTRGGRLTLTGRVRRGGAVRSAAAAATTAVIQLRWDGAWYPLKSAPVRGDRFRSELKLPAMMRGRLLILRVVVPKVGKSSSVKVRAR
jgi:hypothetical protein